MPFMDVMDVSGTDLSDGNPNQQRRQTKLQQDADNPPMLRDQVGRTGSKPPGDVVHRLVTAHLPGQGHIERGCRIQKKQV